MQGSEYDSNYIFLNEGVLGSLGSMSWRSTTARSRWLPLKLDTLLNTTAAWLEDAWGCLEESQHPGDREPLARALCSNKLSWPWIFSVSRVR